MKSASIIIRTKNEEQWIGLCLRAVKAQSYRGKVEIILVDNNSTDKTVEKAKSIFPDLTVISLIHYLPGDALNQGIREATGDIIVCLSSHCIPVNQEWLEELSTPLVRNDVGAVYGRQVPTHNSSVLDKRDLWLTFGLESRDQTIDPFFHNANSAFLKTTWSKNPFDSEVKNLEDRIWATRLQEQGLKIHYTPTAIVYHEHGIHQNADVNRASGVVKIMEQLNETRMNEYSFELGADSLSLLLILPISRRYGTNDSEGLKRNIGQIEKLRPNWSILALPSDQELEELCRSYGIESITSRLENHSNMEDFYLGENLKDAVAWLDQRDMFFDFIATLDVREEQIDIEILNRLASKLWGSGSSSAVAVKSRVYSVANAVEFADKNIQVFFKGNWNCGPISEDSETIVEAAPHLGTLTAPALLRSGIMIGDNPQILRLLGNVSENS